MVGEPLLRKAQIVDVVEKQGATPLKLCKVEYSYFGGNSAAVRRRSADRCDPIFTETQTIVYIAPKEEEDAGTGSSTARVPSALSSHPAPAIEESPADVWAAVAPDGALRALKTNATMLFRYSALTFNGHRIHYDLPYTMEIEGYPGLVVHGPLVCTVLTHVSWSWRARGR